MRSVLKNELLVICFLSSCIHVKLQINKLEIFPQTFNESITNLICQLNTIGIFDFISQINRNNQLAKTHTHTNQITILPMNLQAIFICISIHCPESWQISLVILFDIHLITLFPLWIPLKSSLRCFFLHWCIVSSIFTMPYLPRLLLKHFCWPVYLLLGIAIHYLLIHHE